MAECTISRCSHERRVFRKELHKWSKEILYVLGLERLAEELMGVRKWKVLVQPFTDLESDCKTDWFPEDTCYICSAKKQPPYDPASGILPTVEGYNTLRIDTDDHSASCDLANLSGSFNSCSSALSPWHMAALNSHGVLNSPPLLEQPLDLSVNSVKQLLKETGYSNGYSRQAKHHVNNNETKSKSVLKVPQIPLKAGQKKRLESNSKRSYTEDELQAALRDIQSGKLGTRRAAVIYGIPRSTLRNKVYKLANESKSRAHNRTTHSGEYSGKNKGALKNTKPNTEVDVPICDKEYDKINQSPASESLRQLLKHTITQKVQSALTSTDTKINSDSEINVSSMTEDIAAEDLINNLKCSQAMAPVFSNVFSDLQPLVLSKSKENSQQSFTALNDDKTLPLLPGLIRRLTEERLEIERNFHKESDLTESLSSPAASNVILKVPSFKPAKSPSVNNDTDEPQIPDNFSSNSPPGTSSHSLSGNKGVTVTLKELISRSISLKIDCNLKNNAIDDDSNIDYPFNLGNTTCNVPWNSEISKEAKETCLSTTNNSNSSDHSKSEKRTRPKRGRYRNYDRDNLARAVRAVQKGEMSVHRAGTFYGVPHSTLEYKVKERHLLRPRKRDIFNSTLMPDSTESLPKLTSESSLQNISQALSEPSNGLPIDSENPHRPTMGSFPSPLSLWQNMPFLSLDFTQLSSNNFFASQMMRKLQENALLHEENQKRRKGQEYGLIESLIKSTLERSVSPESKSPLILSAGSVDTLNECKNDIDDK